MKRRVEVQPITARDGKKLQDLAERSSNGVVRHRAHIVWCSWTGMSAPVIAEQFEYDVKHVRIVIHQFNAYGFDSLEPAYGGGARPVFSARVRQEVVDVALGRPKDYGCPFTRWSLRKLAAAVKRLGIIKSMSHETVRTILNEAGVSYQRTKTWKESNDPLFERKRRRILRLYRNPPADGRVICVDEFGPLNLQPHAGSCWANRSKPQRIRATYRRTSGVRHMLAALDLKTNRLLYRIRKRKRRQEFSEFVKMLRSAVPRREKIYLVLDNYSPHNYKPLRRWARAHGVVLVYTPTNASWLNRIECHFAPLREFVLRNSDYPTHEEQAAAIRAYVRWRNREPNNAEIQRLQKRVKVA